MKNFTLLLSLILINALTGCSNDKYTSKDGSLIFQLNSSLFKDQNVANDLITIPDKIILDYGNKATDFDKDYSLLNHLYDGDFEGKRIKNLGLLGIKNNTNFTSSPIIYKNKLYYINIIGELIAFEIINNTNLKDSIKKIWSYSINETIKDKLDFISGNAILNDELNQIFISTTNGYIACIDGNNGKSLWKNKLNYGFNSSFTIDKEKNLLYIVALSDDFFAIDIATGTIAWQILNKEKIKSSSSQVPKPLLYKDKIIIAWSNGKISCYSKENHDLIFEYPILSNKISGNIIEITDIDFQPSIIDDVLVVGGIKTIIYGININSGRPIWSIDTGLHSNILHNGKNYAFFINERGQLVALNTKYGLIKWIFNEMPLLAMENMPAHLVKNDTHKIIKTIARQYPLFVNDKIIISDMMSKIYEIEPNDGFLVDTYDMKSYGINGQLIFNNNKCFANDTLNQLYVLE